jgi:hypothetical protein
VVVIAAVIVIAPVVAGATSAPAVASAAVAVAVAMMHAAFETMAVFAVEGGAALIADVTVVQGRIDGHWHKELDGLRPAAVGCHRR